jgi:hypothetical protein
MIAVLAGPLATTSCSHAPKPPEESPTFVVWRTAGSWSGHGDVQTETFQEEGPWRIRWETKNEKAPGSGHLRVTVRSAVSGRAIAVPVDHDGAGQDTENVYAEPRLYYLGIDSRGVDWKVTVEEASTSTKPGP